MGKVTDSNTKRSVIFYNVKSIIIIICCLVGLWFLATSCEEKENKAREKAYDEAYANGYSEGNSDGYRKGYNQAVVDICDNGAREAAVFVWGKDFVSSAFGPNGVDVYP